MEEVVVVEEKVVGEHREERADRGEAKVGQVFK